MAAGISGAVLAALLSEAADAQEDTSGLLFGRMREVEKPKLRDDGSREGGDERITDMEGNSQEREARVTGFCYGAGGPGAMAISDALGFVDNDSLRLMIDRRGGRGDPPLGWFVQRRNTPLRPSLRETAVCARLRSALAAVLGCEESETPFFLLLVTASRDRSSLAHSYEYKMLQYRSAELKGWPSFHPCSMKVVNIGPEFRGLYDSFSPTAAFPLLPPMSAEGNSHLEDTDAVMERIARDFPADRLHAMMAESNAVQVTQMEALYRSVLERLQGLAEEVASSAMVVKQQEEANRQLRSKGGPSQPH